MATASPIPTVLRAGDRVQCNGGRCAVGNGGRVGHGLRGLGDGHIRIDLLGGQIVAVLGQHQVYRPDPGYRLHLHPADEGDG